MKYIVDNVENNEGQMEIEDKKRKDKREEKREKFCKS